MINLLPKISEKVSKVEESKLTYWTVKDADPQQAKISKCLQQEFSVDVQSLLKYKENTLPAREPNYVPPEVIAQIGPSHINQENRGVPDDILISTKQFIPEKNVEDSHTRPSHFDKQIRPLVVKIVNTLTKPMDLFVQTPSRMVDTSIRSNKSFLKCLDGLTKYPEKMTEKEIFHILCSNVPRSTVTTTNRQEIKDYRFFSNQRIGLEVELVDGRLVSSKVVPGTQASPYEKFLDGAEIVAINGERVINLDEFQDAMARAKKEVFITLTIATYKDGKQKIDELYMHNFSKSKHVKSLFSNLLGGDDAKDRRASRSSSRGSRVFGEHDDDDDEEDDEDEDGDQPRKRSSMRRDRKSPEYKDEQLRRPSSRGQSKSPSAPTTPADRPKYFLDDDHPDEKASEARESKDFLADDDGAMIAGKTVVNRQEPLEGPAQDDDVSVHSRASSQGGDWNALTKVEQPVVFPFTSVVGVPPELKASTKWGNPRHYLQFSNFSAQWKLEVFWVDEEGVLITRSELYQGDTHFELFSANHVWALKATPLKSNQRLPAGSKSVESLPSNGGGSSSLTGLAMDALPIVLLRPSKACCVHETKCISLLWSPGSSLSVSNLLYSKATARPNSSGPLAQRHREERIKPAVHVQLFEKRAAKDPSPTVIRPGSGTANLDGNSLDGSLGGVARSESKDEPEDWRTLGKLTRKPLRSSRVLSKMHK